MNNNRNLQEIRAISLVISEQELSVRTHLLDIVSAHQSQALAICMEECPKIDWSRLAEQGLSRINQWQSRGVSSTSFFEEAYPAALRSIEDSPPILFSKGKSISNLNGHCCLAIVGSRRADSEGLDLSHEYARQLSNHGVVIISGLAIGIDGAAHRGALSSDAEFPTVAVLGSGLNVIYPASHRSLAEQILDKGGIVISQFAPETPPYPSNFLNRNRLVSGLSKAVLVIEATLKSGSLVTARNALEQGKDVLVIPGDINNPRYEGSNRLIQQGANLIVNLQDIVDILGISMISGNKNRTSASQSDRVSEIENQIVKYLEQHNEVRLEELIRKLGSVSFEKELLMLELQGMIKRLPGNILRLNQRR